MSIKLVQFDYTQESCNLSSRMGAVDLTFADPPYNLGVSYEDDVTRDRLSAEKYEQFTQKSLSQLAGVLRPGGVLFWMTPEQHADFTGPLLSEMIGPRMFRIVWEEPFSQYQGDRTLTRDYRFIFCHRREGDPSRVTFNPDAIRVPSVRQLMGDKRANPAGRVPGCIWKFRRLQGNAKDRVKWHPCQLSPELLTRIVAGWSNSGDTVLDAFAGSGIMGRVCLTLARNYIGVDRSATYLQKIQERLLDGRDGK